MESFEVFEKDSVLFREGDNCDYLYLVKSGSIVLVKEVKGRLFAYPPVENKGILGDIHIFDNTKYLSNAVALERSEVYKIKRDEIEEVMGLTPDWVSEIMQTLSDRLAHSFELMAEHNVTASSNFELTNELESKLRKILN